MAVPLLLDRPARQRTPPPATAPPRQRARPSKRAAVLVGAVTAGALATVPGSQPRTTEFTSLDCGRVAVRDEHLFPHDYVGEVFLQVGTRSPDGARTRFVIAWGPNRWPPARAIDIPSARAGGVMFMFLKFDGAEAPLYPVVFSAGEPLCFRWGTTSTIPGVNGRPAYGWTLDHDRV
ncbi:hypothetical protein [Kutzneria sp. NPDC051319]|uniref:hypothetical protein n=1 Tax=Kutzneria sp. NPDC051319 TaxID=3155047 RepID=UPI00343832E2